MFRHNAHDGPSAHSATWPTTTDTLTAATAEVRAGVWMVSTANT